MIRTLDARAFAAAIPQLSDILMDAVDAGAGVSFMKPLAQPVAEAFWRALLPAVASGNTIPLAATVKDALAGVVLLQLAPQPNQPHRADVAKLLVHRNFRQQGLGRALMTALEGEARARGRRLLTFDAVAHGPVEAFYKKLGFICAGYYPGYALSGDGQLDDTALFYKQL